MLLSRFAKSVAALTMTGVISAASVGCAAGDRDTNPTVVLKFADAYSATHPIGKAGAQPFLEYLQEHGPDVGLEIEYYGSGQMGKSKDMPTLLRTDVVQIAVITPSNVSSQLPLSSVSELPGLVDNACHGADALIKLMQENGSIYENELEPIGIRPLWVAFVTDYEIMTANREVREPEDIQGQLVRSNGGMADRIVDHLGASGVSLPGPDLYEALSRGTVEGALFPPVSVLSYKLDETLAFSTVGANLGLSNSTYAISTQAWARLSSEQRAVVTKASTLANENACRELPAAADAAFEAMEANGVQLLPIEGTTKSAWDSALIPIREEWVRDLESIGKPARLVLTDFEQQLERAADE
ncbi:TRAP transporter substrate-binding protein DctP [Rhodococcus sp. IEGM 1366]|uniref:TRAP transporter substrate-binding protein DctP n=1 Tax=Rhodococcus sp. IEGM 1366 TaxID=3082223 RepID=UPI00295321DE|nr:TRAP transporter substrate-binding protein DctP [Rhodococcus sp. IEGM 1366]MDV8070922.1 TRAP transporter substrate-binding protein DctP [Rhodococcus sp. IEGM 1366]